MVTLRVKAYKIYDITQSNMSLINIQGLVKNYVFVTIGNLIGGVLLGTIIFYIVKVNGLKGNNDFKE